DDGEPAEPVAERAKSELRAAVGEREPGGGGRRCTEARPELVGEHRQQRIAEPHRCGAGEGAQRQQRNDSGVQGVRTENVSQLPTSPRSSPVRNQRARCCDVPWVKPSGTTTPWVRRWMLSSPTAAAALRASSMSPCSNQLRACCEWCAQMPA